MDPSMKKSKTLEANTLNMISGTRIKKMTPVKNKNRMFTSERKVKNFHDNRFLQSYKKGIDLSHIPLSESKFLGSNEKPESEKIQISKLTNDEPLKNNESDLKPLETLEDTDQMKLRFGAQGETSIVEIDSDQIKEFMGGKRALGERSKEFKKEQTISKKGFKEKNIIDESEYRTNSVFTDEMNNRMQSSLIKAVEALKIEKSGVSPERNRFLTVNKKLKEEENFRRRFYTNSRNIDPDPEMLKDYQNTTKNDQWDNPDVKKYILIISKLYEVYL